MSGIGDIDVDGVNERVACMLLLDTSGSMSGQPIQELNAGLQSFKQELDKDEVARYRVEIAIVTFGPVQLVQDFQTADNFNPPNLVVTGATPTGEAIEMGLNLVEQRKAVYKANQTKYWRPWVMLITDGSPTDHWNRAAQLVHDGYSQRKFSFFAIGVAGADMGTLSQIAPPQCPPMMLQGTAFKSLFQWLSASTSAVTRSAVGTNLTLPPVNAWAQVTV